VLGLVWSDIRNSCYASKVDQMNGELYSDTHQMKLNVGVFTFSWELGLNWRNFRPQQYAVSGCATNLSVLVDLCAQRSSPDQHR